MKCEEFLFIRQKSALALKDVAHAQRLSFEEMALLCHLSKANGPVRASNLAEYQQVIRPTMTHRLLKLKAAGYLERQVSQKDQRVLLAVLTSEGTAAVMSFSHRLKKHICHRERLHRCSASRLVRYVEAAGSMTCRVADILVLTLWMAQEEMSPSAFSGTTGLLQPSCAMALTRLVQDELMIQQTSEIEDPSHWRVSLTKKGAERAQDLAHRVEAIIIHRN